MRPDIEPYRRRAAETFESANRRRIQPARDALGRLSIPLRENLGDTAINVIWSAADRGIRRVVENPNNLEAARDRLAAGDPLVIYFNHTSSFDVAILGHVIEDFLAPINSVAGFTGLNHFDPQRGENIPSRTIHKVEYGFLDQARQTLGFGVIPVIQEKQSERDYYGEHPDDIGGLTIDKFNKEAVESAVVFLKGDGQEEDEIKPGRILVVAPEGTRSSDGKLLRGHPGLQFILRLTPGSFALPITLIADTRKTVPIFTTTRAVVGYPIDYEDVEQLHTRLRREALKKGEKFDYTKTDLMMTPIAIPLSKRRQGYYREMVERYGEITQTHFKPKDY